jgi:hypothetical protein
MLFHLFVAALVGGATPVHPNGPAHAAGPAARLFNRGVSRTREGDRDVVRFDQRPGMGELWFPSMQMEDGDLEFDVRGQDVRQRSFVGVSFRMMDDLHFDAIYLRPFNFRAADSSARAHAIQYISIPDFDWRRLRAEHPGVYESALDPAPDPSAWVHVRVHLAGRMVTVFLNGGGSPVLSATMLSDRTVGGLGLWVGECSPGDFANFTVTVAGKRPQRVTMPDHPEVVPVELPLGINPAAACAPAP